MRRGGDWLVIADGSWCHRVCCRHWRCRLWGRWNVGKVVVKVVLVMQEMFVTLCRRRCCTCCRGRGRCCVFHAVVMMVKDDLVNLTSLCCWFFRRSSCSSCSCFWLHGHEDRICDVPGLVNGRRWLCRCRRCCRCFGLMIMMWEHEIRLEPVFGRGHRRY